MSYIFQFHFICKHIHVVDLKLRLIYFMYNWQCNVTLNFNIRIRYSFQIFIVIKSFLQVHSIHCTNKGKVSWSIIMNNILGHTQNCSRFLWLQMVATNLLTFIHSLLYSWMTYIYFFIIFIQMLSLVHRYFQMYYFT